MGIPTEAGCCKKEAQVLSALGDQENAVSKLVSLAEGEGRSSVSPLADKINSINYRTKYGQIVLQDILNRLEI